VTLETPRFSVTVPAYNAERTLAETLESVLAQTFSDWELVVVDDGSTDGTRALAERFAARDPRVRVFTQENRGSGGAYNAAVAHARGDLVVMLSSDDLLLPEHLATFDAAARDAVGASVFTSGGWYEYDDGSREAATPEIRWTDPKGCALEELLEACFYGVGAVYRRPVYDVIGGFREDLFAEDYLFWLLALAHGFRHRHISAPLSLHRRNRQQKSADAMRMRETDVRVVTEMMRSGLLSPAQEAAARRSVARLRRAIHVRTLLGKVMSSDALDRAVARTRPARAAAARRLQARAGRAPAAPAARVPPASSDREQEGPAVAFVNNFAGPSLGGGEVQLLGLLKGLSAAGMQTTVVCAAGSALEREARVLPLVRVVPATFSPAALSRLFATVREELRGVRVAQGTGFLTNLVVRVAGWRIGTPIVDTVHVVPGAARLDGESPAVSLVRAALDRVTRRRVSRFVAVSQAVRSGLTADGVDPAMITVIPNGIDLEALRRQAHAGPAVELPEALARVGCVGRLERVKGVEYFLRAAGLLAADSPDVRFIVAGTGSDEPRLRSLATSLGLAGMVDFLGYVEPVARLLTSLDVVVIPSLSEASGLTAMEAMALGVPVVASLVGGLPEVVENGETGLLVPPGDEAALARAIARLLDSTELVHRLADAARRCADSSFNASRMVDAYLHLYRELGA